MDNQNRNSNDPKKNRGGQSLLILLICIMVSLICMSAFSGTFSNSSSRKIRYDQFVKMLDNHFAGESDEGKALNQFYTEVVNEYPDLSY